MVAPQCSTICGSAAQAVAAAAQAAGCCEVLCATALTTGDTLSTVPEFDIPVADEQLVEVTVTGYVTKLSDNVAGTQGGFVYFRGTARRFDADTVLPGLVPLISNTTLQALSLGLVTSLIAVGNTLQFQLDGAAGTYRWDLEMSVCVRDQLVTLQGEA